MNACFYTIETYNFRRITDDAISAIKKHYHHVPFHRFMVNDFSEAAYLFAKFALILLEQYDRVIFYGTDQIMFDKCPKLFEEYDIGAPMNNNGYVNGGLVSISSKEAAKEWCDACNKEKTSLNGSQEFLQSTCFSGKYNSVIFDKDTEPIYGIKYHSHFNKAKYENGKLIINEKPHVLMHFAGGDWTDKKAPRIRYEEFDKSVQDRIKELIKSDN